MPRSTSFNLEVNRNIDFTNTGVYKTELHTFVSHLWMGCGVFSNSHVIVDYAITEPTIRSRASPIACGSPLMVNRSLV